MDEFPNKVQDPGVIQWEEDDDNEPEFITLLRTRTEDFGVGLQLETLIRTDNKQEFVSFLKTQKFDYSSMNYNDFQTRLLKLLCYRRAIGCATALLNGETVLPTVDLNEQLLTDPLADEFEEYFPTPLRIAAEVLCYGLTELFIQHGANPSRDGVELSQLPLNFALDALCHHKIVRDFPAGESVHKLFSLFRLQELKEPFDTIKLLVSRTKQVLNLGVCCVEEWNLVKLAALLMVASDKLVIGDDIYSSPIPMLIGLQHGLESDLEKKQVMRSMWQAFRLVERSSTLMVEDEVVPPDVAYKFLTEVKLHDNGTHMVSADLDRFVAELLQRSGGFLETSLVEKKCLKPPTTHKRVFSAEIDWWAAQLRLGDKVLLEARLMKKMSSKLMYNECIYFIPNIHQIEYGHIRQRMFDDQIDRAMRLDHRDTFVRLVNHVEFLGNLDLKNNLPKTVRRLMFRHDSANCAAAVLAGETDAFLSFRDLTDVGWPFLHNAAKLGAPKLTALFLENGFLADDRRDCDELKIESALPLNVALESIRDHIIHQNLKNNKSAIDLVVSLCASEIRNMLETIRLLVLKMKDVKFELSLYLKEGKMIELCALLMVAHKELLPLVHKELLTLAHKELLPSLTHKAGVAGTIRHFSTSAHTVYGNLYEHRDLHVIKETLLLLDIFGKIGDHLSAYIRLEQDTGIRDVYSHISWLLVRAGISDALYSKGTITFSRHPSEGHKMVLGRANLNLAEQSRGPKLSGQAALSLSSRPGAYSSVVFARFFHAPAKIHAHFAAFVSAKRLVDVLRRRHLPMQCISIVAALTSGFGRM
ncbi:uncharacterized protein LOC141656649 isoform X2 [Silene latifolia]|uniref:uncharacterized protein LOC141656649 isoform X2 n=1 Tax=Silene latifolia TaxID=37657 RepID=UPI003D76C771